MIIFLETILMIIYKTYITIILHLFEPIIANYVPTLIRS